MMPKSPTAYHRPDTLDSALQLLNQPDTFALGGGTKLLAHDVPGAVVDLQKLALNQITWNGDTLSIGAALTLTELADALAAQAAADSPAPLLQQAIQQAGPNTYRNAATVGGSIASRLPDSELLAVLLVLDATLTLYTPQQQTLPLADYLAAAERPFGLITGITLSWHTGQGKSERVARTPADYPIVSVTLWQPQQGNAALAATGIAQRPLRLHAAETHLHQGHIEQAAATAQTAVTHPGDFRGDTAYRTEMVAVLVKRVCK
ncbi:MAG: FAD binding domain-containing protein [Chloroflexota bacterium]